MDRVGMTSYSDYMRCLAAKYNNNQTSGPALSSPPQKADLLPLLAAHGSHFPAAFSIPGLSLFNPFLTSQASDSKPAPTVNITSNASERLKRPKEDPLDLTDKKLKREDSVESEKSLSPKTPRTPSPRVRPNTPKTRAMADWTVEEVAEFVSKVDDCQHYAKIFSDNLIDGSCLPKLTETHLTTVMGLKLGPAIKLITNIKSLLPPSSDSSCIHCSHCHSNP